MSYLLSYNYNFIITKKIPVSRKFFGTGGSPQFFLIAGGLGMSLSGLHDARCRMDEVTGPHELRVSLAPLEPVVSTQKVLADEPSPRNAPRSSPSHPILGHLRLSGP
jgi:hypothetical protein